MMIIGWSYQKTNKKMPTLVSLKPTKKHYNLCIRAYNCSAVTHPHRPSPWLLSLATIYFINIH